MFTCVPIFRNLARLLTLMSHSLTLQLLTMASTDLATFIARKKLVALPFV